MFRAIMRARANYTPQRMLAASLAGIQPRPSVLDIGSSTGQMWTSHPLQNLDLEVTLMDPAIAKGDVAEDFRVIAASAPGGLADIISDSFDVVVAFDLIEHLSKEDGYLLLYEMERISRKLVVVYTPTGFLWQPPSPNNPFNAHISGWRPRDLKHFGFKSFTGLMGFGILLGPYAKPRFAFLEGSTSLILKASQFFARPFPLLAHSFYAEKEPRLVAMNQPYLAPTSGRNTTSSS